MYRKYIFFFFLFIVLLLSKCAWTPKSVLPKYFHTIYINNVVNETLQPDIADLLTRKIKENFKLDGRLFVTDYVVKANGVLFCTIVEYKKIPISFTDAGVVDGNLLKIKLHIKLRDIKSGKWLHNNYIEMKTKFYLKTEPVETELEAQQRLLNDLAEKVVSKVIEGW